MAAYNNPNDRVVAGKIADAMSLAATGNTPKFIDKGNRDAVIEIDTNGGTHVGTFSLYGTVDPTKDQADWALLYTFDPATATYTSTLTTVASGTANHSVHIYKQPVRYLYVKYTRTSGTGTATIRVYEEK